MAEWTETYPQFPLYSHLPWLICIARSGVWKLSATIWHPAFQNSWTKTRTAEPEQEQLNQNKNRWTKTRTAELTLVSGSQKLSSPISKDLILRVNAAVLVLTYSKEPSLINTHFYDQELNISKIKLNADKSTRGSVVIIYKSLFHHWCSQCKQIQYRNSKITNAFYPYLKHPE